MYADAKCATQNRTVRGPARRKSLIHNTVFVRMQGKGGDWHLYGIDDCVLTHEDVPLRFGPNVALASSNRFQMMLYAKAHTTNQIEVSTNLTTWRPLGSVVNQAESLQFTAFGLTNTTVRFFRARPR